MGVKGRRRTSTARAFETDPSATYLQEKKQQPSTHATTVCNQQEQQGAASEATPPSTRPQVVSCVRKKRTGGVIVVLRYSDGSRYEGQTSDVSSDKESDDVSTVLRHGKGMYVTHNGHVFDGEWVHGVFQGWVPSED